MHRRAIAFVTHAGHPAIAPDDRHALDVLAARTGAPVEGVPWDAAGARWEEYAAVVVRSTWDYHRRPGDFLAWVDRIEGKGANLWNPAALIRWNADKRYLGELARAGVPAVPTAWLPRGADPDLAALLEERRWGRAVVKPSVSATAWRTWLTDPAEAGSEAGRARLRELLADGEAMVQPFLEEVAAEGEWSFVFFGDGAGELSLSHTVLKRPAAGDFRVQDEHGGSSAPAVPPGSLRQRVTAVAGALWPLLPARPIYARLDGVQVRPDTHPGGFLLMELELIEPVLFLGADPAAPGRFAEAVASALPGRR
ncbi:MAG TPA: hypothetical protein VF037_06535 [Gemmatimonadales bacterium]